MRRAIFDGALQNPQSPWENPAGQDGEARMSPAERAGMQQDALALIAHKQSAALKGFLAPVAAEISQQDWKQLLLGCFNMQALECLRATLEAGAGRVSADTAKAAFALSCMGAASDAKLLECLQAAAPAFEPQGPQWSAGFHPLVFAAGAARADCAMWLLKTYPQHCPNPIRAEAMRLARAIGGLGPELALEIEAQGARQEKEDISKELGPVQAKEAGRGMRV